MTKKILRLPRLGLRGGVEGALIADARLKQRLVAALQFIELPPRQVRAAQRVAGGSPGAAASAQAMTAAASESPKKGPKPAALGLSSAMGALSD